MKKRNLVALLLSVVMVLSLIGCNSKKEDTTNTETEATKTETEGTKTEDTKADLVWAGWSGEEDSTKGIIDDMINSYNEKGGSQVSWTGWPWADTQQQLIIRNQGSEVLDIAQVDIGMFGALSEMDILVDMNEIMGEDYLSENYDPAALEVGQVNGKQLGMPWSIASIGMLYNPSLLAKVGYTEPPKTIAEFEDCMQKLKEYDPEIIPYGIATKEGTMATDFQPWLWTFGGSILDENGQVTIDNDASVEATTWYKGLIDKDYMQMNVTRFDARQLFAQDKIAFYDDAISARGVAVSNGLAEEDLTDKIQPMERPVLKEGDTPQSAMWGHLLVVFKKSEHQEQAADFIKHVVNEEQALKYLESNGMLPVLNTALNSEAVTSDAWASKWVSITKSGRKLEFATMSNGGELNNVLVEELQSVLIGDKEITDALASAKTRLTSALEE